MTFGAEEWEQRCPYCQSLELIRLDENTTQLIDAFRCPGCGSQFNVDRGVDEDAPLEPVTLVLSS